MGSNRNKIGLGAAVVIGMNAMIGAGIVAIPSLLSSNVGPAGIFSYCCAIVFAICIVLSLGHLAQMHPGKGWSYLYPSLWGGHGVGMFSASLYLAGVLVAMGFIVQEAGRWCYALYPLASPGVLGSLVLAALTLLVLAGAEASSITQYVIAACVLIPLLLISAVCWFHLKPEYFVPFMPRGIISVVNMVPIAMFSLMGFESISSLYSIVKEPRVNVPRAAVIAILAVGFIYIFFASGIIASVPASLLNSGDVLACQLQQTFPTYSYLFGLILISALFAIIGTLHSMIWSLSALFTDVLEKTKSSFIRYALENNMWNEQVSVLVTSSIIFVVSLLFHAKAILQLTALGVVTCYLLSIMLLLFERKEWKSGRNIITLVGVLGSFLMLYAARAPLMDIFAKLTGLFIR